MNIDEFINNNNISILVFTNNKFSEFNTKITSISNKCGESNFLVINSNTNSNIIQQMNIKSIPMIYIYKNSKLIEEVFGTYNNICDIIRLHF
jgi:thioredoxin-like negative regulator of GroEL